MHRLQLLGVRARRDRPFPQPVGDADEDIHQAPRGFFRRVGAPLVSSLQDVIRPVGGAAVGRHAIPTVLGAPTVHDGRRQVGAELTPPVRSRRGRADSDESFEQPALPVGDAAGGDRRHD